MKTWEYRIVSPEHSAEDELNKLARQGWELTAFQETLSSFNMTDGLGRTKAYPSRQYTFIMRRHRP